MRKISVETLGNVVAHKKGFAFKSEWFEDYGVPIVKVTNFTESSVNTSDLNYVSEKIAEEKKAYSLSKDDVVIQTVGSWPNNPASVVGKVIKVPKELDGALLNQNAVVLYPSAKVHKGYLFFLLKDRSFKGYIINTAQGAANQASITLDSIFRFQFYLPDFEIQEKIAAILSAYDDLIENNKRRIALLEKMAEEIYREWFVRMRFPGHEKAKFEKGVPKGWEKKRLGEFCMLQRGFDLPDSQVVAGEYPVIASTSIKTYHNQYKVKPPVITTGRSGSLGKVLFTNSKAWPLNTTLFVKNFFGNSPYLIYYTLKNMGLENFNAGAGVPSLNRNHINGISLAVPSETLQQAFDHKIDGMFKQSELLVMANDKLTRSRDMLLSRLISGKLPVENLNIQFPPGMMDETKGEAAVASAKEDTDAKPHHGRRHRAGNTKEAKA